MGVPGQKKGESESQGIKGESVENLCLWMYDIITSLLFAPWRSGGFSKA